MKQLVQQLLVHLRGMWNRRWIGLAAAWIAAIAGVAVVSRIPERFEARARVYVDTQSLLRPVMAGLSIQPNFDQQVALISYTLISRPNIEKLVHSLGLDANVNSRFDLEQLVDSVSRKLQLAGDARSNAYVISYRDSSPQRAEEVVQSLLTIFIESSLGDTRQDTRTTLNFLDEQIARYEQSLRAAENRLKEFRLKYLGVPGQSGQADQDFFGKMSRLGDEIAYTKRELRAAEQSRDSYRRALAGETSALPADPSVATSTLAVPEVDSRLSAQKARLDELLRNYTEQHPDVVGTRRVIADLEAQRKVEMRALEKAARTSGNSAGLAERNPVYQQIRMSLANSEAEVASLQAKLASYEGQYAQLKASARMVPEVEAELAQLNRDYDIQKKNYSDLLARREAATMGVDVQKTEGEKFRIIDPPRVSPQPVQPTRVTLLAMTFALSLAAGLFAAFVASQIRPTFHDARALREISERPILGTLALRPSAAMKRKKRLGVALFVSGLAGLAASFAGIFAFIFLMVRVA
jgi:polysaccharide chain length determinant protein (PEP-CTERM system associated)